MCYTSSSGKKRMSANGSPVSLAGYHLTFDDEFSAFASSPDGSSGWQTQYPYDSRTHGGAVKHNMIAIPPWVTTRSEW